MQATPDYKKLDNPVWHSLTEKHTCFSEGNAIAKRYQPNLLLFAGIPAPGEKISSHLDAVVEPGESIFLFEPLPSLPSRYTVEAVVECCQMVCKHPVNSPYNPNIRQLSFADETAMFELMKEVFPGYYLRETWRVGNYYGIFEGGKLVAMAGERFCMNGFTEISAVATRPGYTGRGYASQLVSHLQQQNLDAGIIPFLHTGATNSRAIAVYEKLGYVTRRLVTVSMLKRNG